MPVKTAEQQAALMLTSVRDQMIRHRTQLANAICGHAAEFGLTAAKGMAHLVPLLERIQADESLPALARELFAAQAKEYEQLQTQIDEVDAQLMVRHRLVAERKPYVRFFAGSQSFIETIEGSETLKARARAIRDELAQVVSVALSESVRRDSAGPDAHLAAGLLLATWAVALIQAHRTFRQGQNAEEAQPAFLTLIDRGTIGPRAAMAGTPYA